MKGTIAETRAVFPSGHCEKCDRPRTAHEVRRCGRCDLCLRFGLDLIDLGKEGDSFEARFHGSRVHIRCLVKAIGIDAVAKSETASKRARLCCLSKRQMQRILDIREKMRRGGDS
jgi:hypothetical protein